MMAAHELYFISFILAQLLYLFIIFFSFSLAFSLTTLHVPFFPSSSTSAGRHFASTHNGALLFVVRIRFRFVNEMELNEMYNLLCLGDFGSQCAMRKTKPKSHFRFLLLCNIYSTICKLIHTSMYEYISLYWHFIWVLFIPHLSLHPPRLPQPTRCQFSALVACIELNRHLAFYSGSYCSVLYCSLSIKCTKEVRIEGT